MRYLTENINFEMETILCKLEIAFLNYCISKLIIENNLHWWRHFPFMLPSSTFPSLITNCFFIHGGMFGRH